jgi:Flp pilus assembly protein TadG
MRRVAMFRRVTTFAFFRMLAAESGSVAIAFGLATPILVFAAGAGVDYAGLLKARTVLQGIADGAALAGARTLSISNTNAQIVDGQVKGYVAAHVTDATAQSAVQFSDRSVTVNVRQNVPMAFLRVIGSKSILIAASAKARVTSQQVPNCVVTLDPFANSALQIQKGGLLGPGCMLYSNSAAPNAIDVSGGATLTVGAICSHGGVKRDNASTLSLAPRTDCPILPDPLASLPPPITGNCTETKMQVNNLTTSLIPGVYCGGLTIAGTSAVTLQPGIYIIKDGPLHIKDKASVTGSGVTFFLTGKGAILNVSNGTSMNLSAPAAGAMAGMLIYEDRLNHAGAQHVIQSRNAPNMLGTIYLPQGKLNIGLQFGGGGSGIPVAQSSAWTVVIAQKIAIQDDMQIAFNTYYDATAVKPPAGLGQTTPTVSLSN